MSVEPFGSWSSPVTPHLMTAQTTSLGTPIIDGDRIFWTETRADQGGRTAIRCRAGDESPTEVTGSEYNVRSRVHEYGGGAYAAADGVVVFANYADQRLYRTDAAGSPPVPLTPEGGYRYADLELHPDRGLVLAVREEHQGDAEPVNAVVQLELAGDNADGGTVLCSGSDFYAAPRLGPDDRIAWVEWHHPNMPWDATALMAGRLDGGRIRDQTPVAGGPLESAIYPEWLPTGELIFISDRTNWWNLYLWDGSAIRPLHRAEAEFCEPPWTVGDRPYVVVDATELICTWRRNGAAGIGRLDVRTGDLHPFPDSGEPGSLTTGGGRLATVMRYEDRPDSLSIMELAKPAWTELRAAGDVPIPHDVISTPMPVSWSSKAGPVFGWYYSPTNPGHSGPDGELPPLITRCHGGPTGFTPAGLRLDVQYWTSRGIAVLDVNYGGSTGYGREYRERLRGAWGLVDVEDCVAGATAMVEQGLADEQRLAILGGSAGGYTTLRALTATDRFTAGISLFGVGDLEALAKDTHKFESHYLDGLIGPYPEALDTYQDRSPIHHVDQLNAPILILQGSEDKVVPPNQAETMAAAVRAKGLPVAMVIFDGEGHGFRRAENIQASIQAQLFFLGRVFGFTPADELPKIEIDNI